MKKHTPEPWTPGFAASLTGDVLDRLAKDVGAKR